MRAISIETYDATGLLVASSAGGSPSKPLFIETYDADGNPVGLGGSGSALTVEEQDGVPSVSNVNTIKLTNGTLTDDGGGVVSIAIGGASTDDSARYLAWRS